MITLTAVAAEQVRRAATDTGADGLGLRVAAKVGADGSVDFGLGFDQFRDNDAEIVCEGVTVYVAPPSQDLLRGVVVDFVEMEPGDFRFIFTAPQQEAPGGCGSGGCGSGGCGSGGCAT
jgi:iron-sulfur cluster assembly protein